MQSLLAEDLTTLVSGFRALGDPLRLKIVDLLRSQELCVCELCEKLDTSQSKLSFHLKALKDADLVQARQEGRWIYYRLNLAQFATLEQHLAEYRRFSPPFPPQSCNPRSLVESPNSQHCDAGLT
ncbi:MAG: ArsR/SmtB family transcription factor [Spirulinaceae cyanobacterium]